MTTFADPGEKSFTVHVPHSPATQGSNGSAQAVATQESYLRLGSPDGTTEQALLGALRAAYTDVESQAAVEAAFGASPTAGITLYTEGDLVQFVNGKADTRVLNDSYVVHVLNREDADASAAGGDARTYRAYFRLGRPSADVEAPLVGAVDPGDLHDFIEALLPSTPTPAIAGVTSADAVLPVDTAALVELIMAGGPLGESKRLTLVAAAALSDGPALDRLDSIRTSGDVRSGDVSDRSSIKAWALGALRGLHLTVANWQRDRAMEGLYESRAKLSERALQDPLARRKLVEIERSTAASADARSWAKGVLGGLQAPEDQSARFSLGDGVALYSDEAVTITTPEALKVTVGKDTRTVLGETYSETYDVSDDTLEAIRNGTLSDVSEVSDKSLVTASLTRREATGVSWRTTKFDLSKTLNVAAADNGSFTLGSDYAFAGGLKFTNSLGVAFDALTGISLSAPLGFKVEIGGGGLETTSPVGKVSYDQSFVGKGAKSVVLAVDPTAKFTLATFKAFGVVVRAGMAVVNGALAAYTAAFASIGSATTSESDGPTANVREMMEAGEAVYLAAVSLNAILAAATAVAGVVQLATQKAAAAATGSSPTQPSNIVINDAGIKLQVGTSYIHIGQQGIIVSGTQVLTASPTTNFIPTAAPGNATPAGITELVTNSGSSAVDIFHLP